MKLKSRHFFILAAFLSFVAMGVLVYMVSLGYKQRPKVELPVVEVPIEEIKKSMESFVSIPSVS